MPKLAKVTKLSKLSGVGDNDTKTHLQSKPKKTHGTIEFSGSTATVHVEEGRTHLFGSTNPVFQNGFVSQLVNVSSKGSEPDESASNFAVAIVESIEPRDELEALLALQMAAVHNASMTMARRLAHVDTLQQQDSAERALNKLTRTYAMQLQALRKYRSGGKQQVTVKHVHVNEGGQAIVGNIERGGAGETKR